MDGTDETAVPLLTDDPKEIPPDPQNPCTLDQKVPLPYGDEEEIERSISKN